MAESTETVLERVWRGFLLVLRGLARGVGWIFCSLGAGIQWIGRQFAKLGGVPTPKPQRRESLETAHARPSLEVEKEVTPPPRHLEPEVPIVTAKAPEIDTPTSKAEILAIIKGAPYKILSKDDRRLMEGILTLKERPVRELMIPKEKIIYVGRDELLGPLVLDRLYQSKMLHFPVKNTKGEIIGAIHTSSLNSLEVKESFRAGEILDPNVYYIREDYTMMEALDTFLRNECYFCLVVNNYGKVVGMVNFDALAQEIFGVMQIDDFWRDDDPLAVAKRRFPVEIS